MTHQRKKMWKIKIFYSLPLPEGGRGGGRSDRDIRRWIEARRMSDAIRIWRQNHHQTGEDDKQESITISEVHNHLYESRLFFGAS